jgi:hypothetical protein
VRCVDASGRKRGDLDATEKAVPYKGVKLDVFSMYVKPVASTLVVIDNNDLLGCTH